MDKLGFIARLGSFFLGLLTIGGVPLALFVMLDEGVSIAALLGGLVCGGLSYIGFYIALKGVPPKFLRWTM